MKEEKNIEELIGNIHKLPTLPGIVLEILDSMKKQDLSLAELGDIIANDMALSAEILKIINSSFFNLPRPISSVTHAVKLLGMNAVQNLALSFTLVKVYKQSMNSSFNYENFWKRSIISAITGRLIAQKIHPSFAEDAFFMGLLHDIGVLALSQCIPDQYELIISEMCASDCSCQEAEKRILGFDHTLFGQHLLKHWRFPEIFSTSVRYHHNPSDLHVQDDGFKISTRITHLASLFADFFFSTGSPMRLGLLDVYTKEYGFEETLDMEALAVSVQEQAKDVLPLFQIQFQDDKDYLSMIEDARQEILHLSSKFLDEMLEQQKKIERLQQRANHDSLTGLMNYHSFQETLETEINRSLRYNCSVSLLFGDIDHFKKVNDTWGHLAGDQVLKSISTCLTGMLRDCDSAARYGGEEFTIILPETDLRRALQVAERLRADVEKLNPEFEGTTIPVTMSFGVACFLFEEDVTKKEFVKKADRALYRAKQMGRNRCCAYQRDGL